MRTEIKRFETLEFHVFDLVVVMQSKGLFFNDKEEHY